jgi:predicted nucleic acid-binding protein
MYAIERTEERMRDHERMIDSRAVMTLAASSGCSAYDCEFVALADASGVPLVTADARILKAFPEIAQPLPGSIN